MFVTLDARYHLAAMRKQESFRPPNEAELELCITPPSARNFNELTRCGRSNLARHEARALLGRAARRYGLFETAIA